MGLNDKPLRLRGDSEKYYYAAKGERVKGQNNLRYILIFTNPRDDFKPCYLVVSLDAFVAFTDDPPVNWEADENLRVNGVNIERFRRGMKTYWPSALEENYPHWERSAKPFDASK
jgi:hypothetical protein